MKLIYTTKLVSFIRFYVCLSIKKYSRSEVRECAVARLIGFEVKKCLIHCTFKISEV